MSTDEEPVSMLCLEPRLKARLSHPKLTRALCLALAVGGLSGCLPEPNLTYPSPASLDFAVPEAPINTPEAPEPAPDMSPLIEEDIGLVEDAFTPPPDMEPVDMLIPDLAPPLEPTLRTEALHWVGAPLNNASSLPPPLKGHFEWVSAPLAP